MGSVVASIVATATGSGIATILVKSASNSLGCPTPVVGFQSLDEPIEFHVAPVGYIPLCWWRQVVLGFC